MMRSDWKEIPFEHYTELFAKLDPREAVLRCNINFDEESRSFSMRYLGESYKIIHPECEFSNDKNDALVLSEKILMLRFLCEGCWTAPGEKRLSYREVPWGEVYFKNFEGRCLGRLARTFGNFPETFARIFEDSPTFAVEKIPNKKFAYRFEFFSNLFLSFQIWPGDDEFPSSAQILFDDNIPAVFSAEDLAVACEAVITRLKTRAAAAGGTQK